MPQTHDDPEVPIRVGYPPPGQEEGAGAGDVTDEDEVTAADTLQTRQQQGRPLADPDQEGDP